MLHEVRMRLGKFIDKARSPKLRMLMRGGWPCQARTAFDFVYLGMWGAWQNA